MTALTLEMATPVGRIVQGDCYNPNTENMEGQPLVYKTGANAGQPRVEYFLGLAIEKNHPGFPEFWGKLAQLGRTGFPQFFDGQGNCTHPGFSWKMIDGDGRDTTGKPWSEREGFAGHWVFRFTSGYAPQLLQMQNGTPVAIPETAGKAIKRGYFAQVVFKAEPNGNQQKPGLYMNLQAVVLAGYGQEISGGVDVAAALRTAPQAPSSYVPAGMSLTPPAGVSITAPAVAGMPTPPGMPNMPTAPAIQPPVGAPLVQPIHATTVASPPQTPSVVATPVGVPTSPMPTPPGSFVQHVLGELKPTALAQGHAKEAWMQMGYTEQMLIDQGIFTR